MQILVLLKARKTLTIGSKTYFNRSKAIIKFQTLHNSIG